MSEASVAVVIEDDPDARELTELVLARSGFTVVAAPDGPAGLAAIREHAPILTTLDVQMPGMDGYAVAKGLREFSLTYLIMITSMASEADVIRGFEAGADDYLVKPFRPRELSARADSMLRRARLRAGTGEVAPADTSWAAALAHGLGQQPPPPPAPPRAEPAPSGPGGAPSLAPTMARGRLALPGFVRPDARPASPASPAAADPATRDVLTYAGLVVDHRSGSVTLDGRPVDLDPRELRILTTLMTTGHRVRSRADLAHALSGGDASPGRFVDEADKSAVDAHVGGLKAKLGDLAEPARLIETIAGVGCRMAR